MVELFADRGIACWSAKDFSETGNAIIKREGYNTSLWPDGLGPLERSTRQQGDQEGNIIVSRAMEQFLDWWGLQPCFFPTGDRGMETGDNTHLWWRAETRSTMIRHLVLMLERVAETHTEGDTKGKYTREVFLDSAWMALEWVHFVETRLDTEWSEMCAYEGVLMRVLIPNRCMQLILRWLCALWLDAEWAWPICDTWDYSVYVTRVPVLGVPEYVCIQHCTLLFIYHVIFYHMVYTMQNFGKVSVSVKTSFLKS